jgi:hypothetical protein
MSPQSTNLNHLVEQVEARIRARKISRGVALTLGAIALSAIAAALAANQIRSTLALTLLRWSPLIAAGVAGWFFVIRPLRVKLEAARLARLIEEKCSLNDRLVTAVEYTESPRSASPAIVDRLIDDAAGRSARVSADEVVDPKYAYGYSGASVVMLLAGVLLLFFGPGAVIRGVNSLYGIGGDSVAANAMFIGVTPGTTRVPRGSDVKVKASLNGFDSSLAQMFTKKEDAEGWSGVVMEPAKNAGEFQALLFNIQDSVSYYVEANGIRSSEFNLEVADLPFVRQLDLVLNFPAYTHLLEKKIENGGEIAALKGTTVQVIAHMTASAKSARIVLNDGTKIEMTPGGDNQFLGQFAVKEPGSYKIEVTSDDGEPYNGSNEYDIDVLEDHPPTVVIDKPGRDLKVTSVQEVFTEARAEDDFGVASLDLHYSVNGGEEKTAKLQDLKNDTPKSLSGAHTFFLEELGLKPGDFISYYATARDNTESGGRQSTSDIYFMEVRPFDRDFKQAQQMGGQGNGDQDSSTLSNRQRDIIAATFKVQRELESYSQQEKDENFGAVALSQEKLKTDAETLAERIRRRFGDQLSTQPDFAKLVELVTNATKEMAPAITALRAQNAKDARPSEERALQQLLRAEAIFREIQVARGGGQGSGSQSEQENLADLFELQLDKMKNQYETVQREQQATQSKQQDELLRKLKELAERQQKQLEQQMRSQQEQGGGGGGGSQRQQQQTIEEAEKMARELERLSRDRRDPKLAEAARQMQQAADDLRRAQASQGQSQNRSSQSGADATSQQLRAMDRMEQARRMLESAQRAGGQRNVQQLRQQAEEALKRQEEIARNVDELAKRQEQDGQGEQSPAAQQKKQQIAERKQQLAEQMSGLERDINQTARGLGQERQQATDKLREASNAIRNNRIPDRIRSSQQMIENGWMEQARERESIIKQNIDQVVKSLQAAEGAASRKSEGESLEDALNRAHELAESLESLRKKLESQQQGKEGQNGQRAQANQEGQQDGQQGQQQGQKGQQTGQQQANDSGKSQAGQQGKEQNQGAQKGSQQSKGQQAQAGQQKGQQGQQGQQQGQQKGQQGQQGQQQGQQKGQQGQQGQQQGQQGQQQGQQGQQQGQQGQQAGNRTESGQRPGQASAQGSTPSNAQAEQANEAGGGPPQPGNRQLESELRERVAEAEDLRRQLGRDSELGRQLGKAIDELRRINPNVFNDPSQLAALKKEVIEPIRQLEIELARRLQAKLGNPGAGTYGEGEAPDRYRKTIEDYYRRLSSRTAGAKP